MSGRFIIFFNSLPFHNSPRHRRGHTSLLQDPVVEFFSVSFPDPTSSVFKPGYCSPPVGNSFDWISLAS